MKTDPEAKLVDGAKAAKPLNQVLKENELVKDMLEESADELASVNRVLNEEFANQDRLPEMENALEKSEAVEIKVQEASDKLSVVNQALEDEVSERHLLEHELADQQRMVRRAARHADDPAEAAGLLGRQRDPLQVGLAATQVHPAAQRVGQ